MTVIATMLMMAAALMATTMVVIMLMMMMMIMIMAMMMMMPRVPSSPKRLTSCLMTLPLWCPRLNHLNQAKQARAPATW